MTTKNLGAEGFFWWFGVVEDRDDPQKLGRVKVRVHNFHGDKSARNSMYFGRYIGLHRRR